MVKFRIYFRRICSEFPEFVDDLGSEVKVETRMIPRFGLEFLAVWWCCLLRQERLQLEHIWGIWF